MKNYELLKPFYSTKFKEVFLYDVLSPYFEKKIKELEILLIKQENINIFNVNWLYSTHEEYYLIGVQNDNVVGITSEGDYEVITNDFALIPFVLNLYKDIPEEERSMRSQDYLNALQNYNQWCKEQGIEVPYEHLKWIE
jgi:hypothetical protein